MPNLENSMRFSNNKHVKILISNVKVKRVSSERHPFLVLGFRFGQVDNELN